MILGRPDSGLEQFLPAIHKKHGVFILQVSRRLSDFPTFFPESVESSSERFPKQKISTTFWKKAKFYTSRAFNVVSYLARDKKFCEKLFLKRLESARNARPNLAKKEILEKKLQWKTLFDFPKICIK